MDNQTTAIANTIRTYVDNAYELRALNDKQIDLGNSVDRTKEQQQMETLAMLVGGLSASLTQENENFDREKFEKACGFTYDK